MLLKHQGAATSSPSAKTENLDVYAQTIPLATWLFSLTQTVPLYRHTASPSGPCAAASTFSSAVKSVNLLRSVD